MIAESHIEEAALAWLRELGYSVAGGQDIAPDSHKAERSSYSDVILIDRLKQAATRDCVGRNIFVDEVSV